MYHFLILLFMSQLFIVNRDMHQSASHQVPENQKYSKITYIMLENTHVVTNTVLKEDYKMGCNLFLCRKIIVCVCVRACDVCVCVYVCMCLHIHTSEFKCLIACQGVVHSTDIQV